MQRQEEVRKVLAVRLRGILDRMKLDFEQLQEIRLRIGAPLLVVYKGKEHLVGEDGTMVQDVTQAFYVTGEEVRETMEYISNYSLYAFEDELRQGFVTIQGGHRVGVAGRTILEQDHVKNMKHISFVNIRLAHQILGCASPVLPLIRDGGSIFHTLIISPPRCGKTTLLRDMIRQLSNGEDGCPGMTIGVVDERSELGACYQGKPQNDLGFRTDILDCCPKVEGMMMLLRSMSPQVIAVDEIGSREDVEALQYVMNCGVRLLATVHGSDMEEIRNKPVLGDLVRGRVFQRYILLGKRPMGRIQAIFDERGSYLGR